MGEDRESQIRRAERREEQKRRTNEKHPCREALSHLPQLSVSTASLPSSCSLSLRKLFPTRRGNREALWFHLERGGGFFTEEKYGHYYKEEKAREEEEHFLSQQGWFHFLLL